MTVDRVFEITTHFKHHEEDWAQARYHVSLIDDVLWTNDASVVVEAIRRELERWERGPA